MAATKRKRASVDPSKAIVESAPPPPKRRASARQSSTNVATNPNVNQHVIHAPNATRASPDSNVNEAIIPGPIKKDSSKKGKSKAKNIDDEMNGVEASTLVANGINTKKTKGSMKTGTAERLEAESTAASAAPKNTKEEAQDPEADGEEGADEEEVKEALTRAPPVNSEYLPLPWKGRLGYACLNTYLRNSNPPVFSSRTCRIASILEHRHPLKDSGQPEHATKNRPDKDKPADIELGKRYVEALCLANIKDIIKMVRWNDRYNIKFMRLSSEMFPFASHEEYGYKLAPFASEALAEAGKEIAELGHRVTTHPGQFTQLGSPRKPVIDNSIRDLEYHDEMLSLLKLPEQLNKDAVMILHMGGIFEGKKETLDRFRENYAKLSQSVKNRLVLENDDMGWSVHDLLPICEELNIPFVLDFHHHNIVFDSSQIREGTKDIIDLFPRIKATWDRKGIRQKMHYSEPTPAAITPRQRRKHSPRVATLPPCPPDMDLMIEAKDKEQAVFELMRTFKLPGYDTFNDVLPYVRSDDNKAAVMELKKRARKSKKKNAEAGEEPEISMVLEDDVGMGGPEGRVYWPPGMEEWLRPKKREVKKKDSGSVTTTPTTKEANGGTHVAPEEKPRSNGKAVKASAKKGREKKAMTPPSVLSDESEELSLDDDEDAPLKPAKPSRALSKPRATSRKARKSVNYNEDDAEMEEA
jgi:UV DNA damage endonuclease